MAPRCLAITAVISEPSSGSPDQVPQASFSKFNESPSSRTSRDLALTNSRNDSFAQAHIQESELLEKVPTKSTSHSTFGVPSFEKISLPVSWYQSQRLCSPIL